MTIRFAAADTRFSAGPSSSMDVSDALRGRSNIRPRDPKISHKTLKPGPYGARTSFMRLP
jgi:hypothetical protein